MAKKKIQITDDANWAELSSWLKEGLTYRKKQQDFPQNNSRNGGFRKYIYKDVSTSHHSNIRRVAAVKRPTVGAHWAVMLDRSCDYAVHSGSCTFYFVDIKSLLYNNYIIGNQSLCESHSTLADLEAPFGRVTQGD